MSARILAVVALIAASPQVASAATRTVCSSGCDSTSISAAMLFASTGDIIELRENRTENVSINKNITLQGSSSAIVLTGSSTNTISVSSSATIRHLTIEPTSSGRAINASSGTVLVDSVTVDTVNSSQSGIGVYVAGANVTVNDSSFTTLVTSNSSGGGAIYVNSGSLIVNASQFTGNRSTYSGSSASGGAIEVAGGATATINDSSFTNNSTYYSGGALHGGGAMIVNRSLFSGNSSNNYSGAIGVGTSTSSLAVDASTFTNNTAPAGGAIRFTSSTAASSITNSTFTGNSSTAGDGGAISATSGQVSLTISGCEFVGNDADDSGGAISAQNIATLKLHRSRFCQNTAGQSGGALIITDADATASQITNNFFMNNGGGSVDGGAIYEETNTPDPMVNSNFFYGNQTSTNRGGGVNSRISVEFYNNLVSNSTGYGYYTQQGGNTLYNTAWWQNTPSNYNGLVNNQNQVTTDPKILPRTYGAAIGQGCDLDFYVQYSSPLRNAGNSTIASDPDSTTSDIGMFSGTNRDSAWWLDADADGYPWVYDCNDNNASIKPNLGVDTTCNGVDDDCDGSLDEDNATAISYRDADGDGYGNPSSTQNGCPTSGYVSNNTDCNDSTALAHPGGAEICDASNLDEDCDGLSEDSDSSASGKTTFYVDADLDGYGGPTTAQRCDAASGFAASATDCDDTNANARPGGTEICDAANVDEDCDGNSDDNDTQGAGGKTNFYLDADSDGYGAGTAIQRCDTGTGYTSVSGDCNDGNATIRPGGAEVCDGANTDEDCDGVADDADASTASGSKSTFYIDNDVDGYGGTTTSMRCDAATGFAASSTDCNDSDAAIRPGGTEVCDTANTDEDCDGLVDDNDSSVSSGSKSTFYRDADSDGYGTSASTQSRCDAGSGYIAQGGDCNDSAPATNPGTAELCDSGNTDEDCDGLADDSDSSANGKVNWYPDLDVDGYGANGSGTLACDAPFVGYRTNGGDCNDLNLTVHPGATELCDAQDRNCDGAPGNFDGDGDAVAGCAGDCDDGNAIVYPGATDTCNGIDENCSGNEDDAINQTSWYRDTDADSYGTGSANPACTQPTGFVGNNIDCNDTNASIRPGAAEVCDGVDQDCDSSIDDGVQITYYQDADADGFGTSATTAACSLPGGYATSPGDCDDSRSSVRPGATETCNSLDDDCDSTIDESVTTRFYADLDDDGYGDAASSTLACAQPSGFVTDSNDCDDDDDDAYPGATEVCDGVDQDCDGTADDDATDRAVFYADTDADGHGSPTDSTLACSAPSGYAATSDDCDDGDSGVYPGHAELCNGADDDCDGQTDEEVTNQTFYRDADGDGFGTDTITAVGCAPPSGYVGASGDCDDVTSTIHPGAAEDCGGADRDCDGDPDGPNPTDATAWHTDADGDGYGAAAVAATACDQPLGTVASGADCDDADSDIHPGVPEHCDGVDEDCDGDASDADYVFTTYADDDADGYGDPATATSDCAASSGRTYTAGDCDDGDAAVHPLADEHCDGVDEDCDGTPDSPQPVDAPTWYIDDDGDGLGDANDPIQACSQPSGAVADDTDCDDDDATIAASVTFYADDDGDAFGDAATSIEACTAPSGYVPDASDCDDVHDDVNPGAQETCDGIDEDCDSLVDDDAVDVQPYYLDLDNDGYGQDAGVVDACVRPTGYSASGGDCDDADVNVSPGAIEQCENFVDDDCNGLVDEVSNPVPWYPDADGDGWGDPNGTVVVDCLAPPDTVSNASDCDDADADVNPNAIEVCNGLDEDCDRIADESAVDATLYYADSDDDGWGDDDSAVVACSAPNGYVDAEQRGDCDDAVATTFPGADEICNEVDDDCDRAVDDEPIDAPTFYGDGDGDGFGSDAAAYVLCEAPGADFVLEAGDCDDHDAGVNPDADEIPYDGVDQDCDAADLCDQDGDAVNAGDGDCGGDDCDDEDPSAFPGAAEIADDGVDQDCDGVDGTDEEIPDGEWVDAAKNCGCSQSGGSGGIAALIGLAAALTGRSRRPRTGSPAQR